MAAGTLSALIYFALLARPLIGGGESVAIAESLVKHGRFADPFAANGSTGPTAHLAPLLPLMLAGWYWLFGKAAAFAVVACVALAHGLHAVLLPRISKLFFARTRPGVIAAICTVLLPIFFIEPLWENMYAAVGLLAFCLAFPRLRGLVDGAKCGIAAGFLILLSPSLIFVIVCWLVYVLCASWPGFRTFWGITGVTCLACVIVLLPWEVRNYQQLGGLPFVRDNFGLELHAANNDCAQARLIENVQTRLLSSCSSYLQCQRTARSEASWRNEIQSRPRASCAGMDSRTSSTLL